MGLVLCWQTMQGKDAGVSILPDKDKAMLDEIYHDEYPPLHV